MSDQADDLRKFATENDLVDDDTLKQTAQAHKPVVIVPGGAKTISESASDLYATIAPAKELFLPDGHVCQVVSNEDGTLKLELLKPAAACSRFENFVRFHKGAKAKDGKDLVVPDVISKEAAEKYLAASARFQLAAIEGLLSCPLITERGGKIHIVSNGYDALRNTNRVFIAYICPDNFGDYTSLINVHFGSIA